jgi:predicted ATPase
LLGKRSEPFYSTNKNQLKDKNACANAFKNQFLTHNKKSVQKASVNKSTFGVSNRFGAIDGKKSLQKLQSKEQFIEINSKFYKKVGLIYEMF